MAGQFAMAEAVCYGGGSLLWRRQFAMAEAVCYGGGSLLWRGQFAVVVQFAFLDKGLPELPLPSLARGFAFPENRGLSILSLKNGASLLQLGSGLESQIWPLHYY